VQASKHLDLAADAKGLETLSTEPLCSRFYTRVVAWLIRN
jgi:hypothetical protein